MSLVAGVVAAEKKSITESRVTVQFNATFKANNFLQLVLFFTY